MNVFACDSNPVIAIMEVKPKIFLTCWPKASFHGQGKKYSIMANPRMWEIGCGNVPACTPELTWVLQWKAGILPWDEYKLLYTEVLRNERFQDLGPGVLASDKHELIVNGDTLLCCCSVQNASEGRCHRTWLAPILLDAGWDIQLDGRGVEHEEVKK